MCKQCNINPVIKEPKLCKECFIKYFENQVKSTIKKYKLISSKDKILVACSGGKDSTTILYILNKLYKKQVEAIIIDVSIGIYSKKNLANIRKVCKEYKIKLNETSFRKIFGYSLCYIKSILNSKGINMSSCSICGILKRYLLNKKALSLKRTKLVTGHNLDDEAQSILMNLFKNNMKLLRRLGPKSGIIENKKFIPRIKPLYLSKEKEIKLYSKLMDFPVVYEKCPCSEEVFRRFISNRLEELKQHYPLANISIINWFLRLRPNLKKHHTKTKLNICTKCGSVSVANICKTCDILSKLNK